MRLVWRWMNPVPDLTAETKPWERVLARISHVLLYALIFAMPLTGWMMSSREELPGELVQAVPVPRSRRARPSRLFSQMHDLHHLLFGVLVVRRAAAHRRRAQTPFHRQERRAEAHVALRRRQVSRMTNYIALRSRAARPSLLRRRLPPPNRPRKPAAAAAARRSLPALPHYVQAPPAAASPSRSCRRAPPARARSSSSPPSFATTRRTPAAGSLNVKVQIASVDTQDKDRDEMLTGADLFDAQKFPTASTSRAHSRKRADGGLEAVGKLTLRGVTQDLRLPLTIKPTADGLELSGETAIKRLDYGVGQGDWKSTECGRRRSEDPIQGVAGRRRSEFDGRCELHATRLDRHFAEPWRCCRSIPRWTGRTSWWLPGIAFVVVRRVPARTVVPHLGAAQARRGAADHR